MNLLIVAQYFPPEMGATQARLYELATRLRARGYTITVLTAMPNYPTGRIFDGYRRRLRMEEDMDGIRIIRTCVYPSKSFRVLPRLASYLSFVGSSILLGAWGLGRQDVVLFDSPPLFIVSAGLVIGRITGAKTLMNLADIWPDVIIRMGRASEGPTLRGMLWLEKFGYEHADLVATTNPGAAAQIRERFPHVRTTVISGGVDTAFFRPSLRSDEVRSALGAGPGDFLVGYCGLHGLAQGLEVVIHAAERLWDEPRIKFVMIGDGPVKDRIVALAQEKNLTNIRFFDRRAKSEMPAIVGSCDASLIPLVTRLPGTMPSKFYEAMGAGVAALAAKGCEAQPLIEKHNTGRTFEPLDGQELAARILDLYEHPEEVRRIRHNCADLAKRFDRDVIADRTDAILRALVEDRPIPETSW